MALPEPYRPPRPPRSAGPAPAWRGLVGERARTAVYGWSERAFEQDYIRRNVFGFRVHIPLRPDMVQHVLLDHADNYTKPDLVLKLLAPTIGRGLLSSDGALWRDQRRIVAARFVPAAVEALVPTFARIAEESAAQLARGGIVDVAFLSTETTMKIISAALFAADPRLTGREAMGHIAAALEGVGDARLQLLLGLPLFPWSRRGLAARRGQIYLRRTLERIVAERLAAPERPDFLGRLIEGLRDLFAPEEAKQLAVDNAMTFYLAGHETTANALTWTLFLLSEQPELQADLAEEADGALAAGLDGLAERLPRLRLVLDESLRLYPPVPRFDRQAIAPDRLGDHDVARGDIVSIWPWLLHRHRRLWDDPDAFDPNRFAAVGGARHRFQYLPFGGGTRTCIGARFATVEALTILARWIAGYRFEPVPGRAVRLSGLVTLRPAGGLPLRITPRARQG